MKKWQTSAIIREISYSYLERSGDREIRSKIWSLPDYPGELTALTIFVILQIDLSNRPYIARWRHLTIKTRILFVFLFIFKFRSPSEV